MNMKKGFSLVELIFSIAILGIIAAVALPKLFNTKTNATVSTIKQDISTITTSVQSYYVSNGSIDKITDAVNINSSTWNIEDKDVQFKVDDTLCVKIELVDNSLNVTIDPTSTTTCQKLYDSGIRDVSYELE